MSEQPNPEALEILACEFGRRPKGAPALADVVASVRSVRREAGSLIVDFYPAAADMVRAVVDAERQCCPTMGWQLETGRMVQLRIDATPTQLDALEQMFSVVQLDACQCPPTTPSNHPTLYPRLRERARR